MAGGWVLVWPVVKVWAMRKIQLLLLVLGPLKFAGVWARCWHAPRLVFRSEPEIPSLSVWTNQTSQDLPPSPSCKEGCFPDKGNPFSRARQGKEACSRTYMMYILFGGS